MDKYLDRHWQFKLVDSIPCPRCHPHKDLAGHTSWDNRMIVLSRRYVLDYNPERIAHILTHEVAHALTPEDWVHGDIFEAKLREIRSE
jgi:hypothetical protein